MPSLALEIDGLCKSYLTGLFRKKRHKALEPLVLSVPAGEVFGYLGPNGSGKSTTLKLLMGLVQPDGGSARVLGLPLGSRSWRRRIGYLPEQPWFYDYLTPREYLAYAGRLLGMDRQRLLDRTRTLLEQVELAAAADTPLRRLSKGNQQRLGLAQALLDEPELVFLDEPMSGLDPMGRHRVRDLIQSLRDRGATVFLSTHILSDAETLCDRIGLLHGGRLLRVGRLDEILRVDVEHMEILAVGADAVSESPPEGVMGSTRVGERCRLHVEEPRLGRVIRAIEDAGGRVLSVQPSRLSLEEYFVREVGRSATP